ncbi:AraC family transcriptional regulator [Dyadobacter sp. CY323]|uniref:helix-turn-helix domain-containing protein n=1 Tax=Dyadobacter sp. CY323 TaxID=2907302 RepID=UPI001F211DA4|nr:helix-turn-helix domain-containing protein [Dyadobacter sp. CY323]MCE6989662.1 helix-turn-helix domain-containing protein [Dyadobacter sp. CY323]
MNEGKYILFFFGALGAFNGLILGTYFVFFFRKRNLSSFFLGCLLLALSIRIGKSVFVYFNPELPKIYLQIGLSACFLIGPALYYFVRATTQQINDLPSKWKWQIAALVGVIFLFGILVPYSTYPAVWNKYVTRGIYTVWFIYILASGALLNEIFVRFIRDRTATVPSEKWLLSIFAANVIIFISFSLALFFGKFYNTYFGGALVFSFGLYSMILMYLIKGKADGLFYVKPLKKPVRQVAGTDASLVLEKLNHVMTAQELFKNPNLTLSELAKSVNVTSHQLSQILNDSAGKNFTSYVNGFRIQEACRMMEANHPFSVEAIGYEVGFNSKSTFYTSFRKIKSTTPLLFKEGLANTAT